MIRHVVFFLGLILWVGLAQPQGLSPLVLPELDAPIPMTGKSLQNDPRNFQFVIVSDHTGGHRPGVFEQATRKTNLLQPEFVITVGDMIEGYTEDRVLIERQWDEFDALADRFVAPFFYVPGNHDFTNKVMAEIWAKRYGRSYYHFLYHDVLFLCLNTEDGGLGKIAEEQITYVQNVLKRHADVRWTFVFMHEPIWHQGYGSPHPDWARIEAALGDRDFTVFAGHWHGYRRAVRNDRRYYILSVTGGGSRLRGEAFGEFDHVVWVTLKDDGPVIANLTLEGILPEDVVTGEQYNQVYELSRSFDISCEPVRIDGVVPDTTDIKMSIKNDSDLPLHLTGGFLSAGEVHIHPHALDLVTPPGETRTRTVTLSAINNQDVSSIPAVIFSGSVAFQLTPGIEPLRLPVLIPSGVYRAIPLPHIPHPPVIDGLVEDSRDTIFRADLATGRLIDPQGTWTGDKDLAYGFDLAMSDDAVYFTLRVTDESLVIEPGRLPWEQDGIELRIDPRDDPERSLNTSPHEERGQTFLMLAFSLAEGGDVAWFEPDRIPEGVDAAWQATAEGYTVEVRIPDEALNALRSGPSSWSTLRLSLSVNDVDDQSNAISQLWWRPDWRSKLHRPGSGTFSRP